MFIWDSKQSLYSTYRGNKSLALHQIIRFSFFFLFNYLQAQFFSFELPKWLLFCCWHKRKLENWFCIEFIRLFDADDLNWSKEGIIRILDNARKFTLTLKFIVVIQLNWWHGIFAFLSFIKGILMIIIIVHQLRTCTPCHSEWTEFLGILFYYFFLTKWFLMKHHLIQ